MKMMGTFLGKRNRWTRELNLSLDEEQAKDNPKETRNLVVALRSMNDDYDEETKANTTLSHKKERNKSLKYQRISHFREIVFLK